ncbi:flippase [Photobacterium ganghwense]|uniref:flippase n=1 Tax=Photobacterium ganghwense TaxID=320778 RepID=UPI004056E88C
MKFLKDTSWNMISFIVPIVIAIPVLGVISRLVGVERFGLFTLILTIFGYANIFDLGLSRAVVRVIALNKNNIESIKEYLTTTSIFLSLVSLIPLLLMNRYSIELVEVLKVSEQIKSDAVSSFEVLSVIFPLIMITTVWQAYLEGCERFRELSLIKTCSSISMSIFPLCFIFIQSTLIYAVYGLILARLFSAILVVSYTFGEVRYVKSRLFVSSKLKELFQFGGWLTLTNIISPIMSSMDRFFLSSIAGAEKVALYTAPAEITNKLLIIPGVISKTAFPRLVRAHDPQFKMKLKLLISLIATIVAIPVFILSGDILFYWLGSGYESSSLTLKILLIGLFFNAITQVPYTSIQAAGYSKAASVVHLIELLPYLLSLYFLVDMFSYNGAAIAWSMRMIIDFLIFSFLERKLLHSSSHR